VGGPSRGGLAGRLMSPYFESLTKVRSVECIPAVNKDIGIDKDVTLHKFLPSWDTLHLCGSKEGISLKDNVSWTTGTIARSSFFPGASLPPVWKRLCPAPA
jgi:hypothetical protein